ncbi:MAG: hypothetical protein QM504_10225 [Pseudomonadota bacterium]
MELEVGVWVKTNYSTGPYRITSITRDCTCPSFLDTLNMSSPHERPTHVHIGCVDAKGKKGYSLNGFDENTLKRVDKPDDSVKRDRLIIINLDDAEYAHLGGSNPVQLSLF